MTFFRLLAFRKPTDLQATLSQILANMPSHITDKTASIVIVGAGVFGLSTALHLAERGYRNVKLLDKQAYDLSHYSYEKGCDAASAGMFAEAGV